MSQTVGLKGVCIMGDSSSETLSIHWAFGFSKNIIEGVHNLTTIDRNAIFFLSRYTLAHSVIPPHTPVFSCILPHSPMISCTRVYTSAWRPKYPVRSLP